MRKVKYGIVSTAQVVPRFIAGVRETQIGEIVAISSRSIDNAQAFAKKYDIPKYYGSESAMFSDSEIDVVYIATYNQGHYASAKAALLAGKHVLLEKPFTLKISEAHELFALAKANHLFLMEAQKSVFLPLTHKVKQIISSGVLGEIISIFSVTAYASVDHVKWFESLEAGGGATHFMASYALSYLPYILGEKIVDFNGVAEFTKGKSDVQSMLNLAFESGILANIYLTTKKGLPKEVKIIGRQAELIIPEFWRGVKAEIHYNDGSREVFTAPFSSDFKFEVDHVNQLITSGATASNIMTPELTMLGVQIMDTLYQRWSSQR
ncbi:MAG: Gfo/Idh/MocA family oxidoreductase [Streptococcaceae bacterium]|nr:Gfo/Idh/MocA family oxidoreductase [Streptococcaceae bacterium]